MSSLALADATGAVEALKVILHPTAVGGLFIVVGVAFDVLGCLGLVRLPDVYNRLQAATKCVTLGTCSILLGAAISTAPVSYSIYNFLLATSAVSPVDGGLAAKALLCLLFILITSPVAAHALARGAHRSGVRLWDGSVGDEYLEDKSRRGEG